MLVSCPSCGKRISDRAPTCPFCRDTRIARTASPVEAEDSAILLGSVGSAAPLRPEPGPVSIEKAAPGSPTGETPTPSPLPAYQRGDFIGDDAQVIEKIGEGGFGLVYLARSVASNQIVALKCLRSELLRDPTTRAMFEKEARIWLDLGAHPNLVRAAWVQEIGGRLYIAMEYIRAGAGRPNGLDGHLARGPIETGQALLWAIQFCRGMEYAVSKGIRCHRDIKPANILIGGDSVVKISDFGIAGLALVPEAPPTGPPKVQAAAADDPIRTVVGTVFGTPSHMPPEQFVDAASCDERSDIYSFGVVLHQMASKGRLPFRPGPPPEALADRAGMYYWHAFRTLHETAAAPPVASPLGAVISRCLQKKREDRYPGFAALRSDLEALYEQIKGVATPGPAVATETAGGWNDRGISQAALGRWSEAVACYEKALELAPDTAAIHNNRGNALRNLGRAAEALASFDKAIGLDPLYPGPWANKGLLYASAQRNSEALACTDRALVLDPTLTEAWALKGTLLGRLSRREEQIEAYDRALALDPRNGLAWFNKGNALSATNRDQALACLDRALACDPNHVPSWDLKGTLLGELGRLAEAVPCHQEAVRLDPRDWASVYNLGNAWMGLDRMREARDAYALATRLNPAMRTAWYNLALATLKLGERDSALNLLEHYLSLGPSEEGLRRTAERLVGEMRAGRTPALGTLGAGARFAADPQATVDAEALPEVSEPSSSPAPIGGSPPPILQPPAIDEPLPPPRPSLEEMALEAARHFNAGRFDEALVLTERILSIEPRDPKALNTRANALFKLGKKEEACASIIPAIEALPGDLTFWLNKAFIEKGAGRLKEALRSALDLIEIAEVSGARVQAVEHAQRLIAEVQAKGGVAAPRDYLGWLGLGFASMVAGRTDPAHGFFDRAIAAAPANSEPLCWKARAFKQQNRADEALALYDKALLLSPRSVEILHDRGVALALLREFEAAVLSFDQALSLNPDHVASLSDRGKYAAVLGRGDEALKSLRRAVALVPDHPAPWLNKALVEGQTNREEDELESHQRFLACAKPEMVLQIEASKRRVAQLRARLAARRGVPPLEVVEPPRDSPEPSPGSRSPTAASLTVIESLFAEDGLSGEEISRLAHALDRGDTGAVQAALQAGNARMAALLKASGGASPSPPSPSPGPEPKGAIALPEPVMPQAVPKASPAECLKRSEMARNQGLFDKALEWADQAIVADPTEHRAWLLKADALFGMRRWAEAAAHARKATEMRADFGPSWVRLASSYDGLNAPIPALAAWEKAVEHAGHNVLNWSGKGVCLARLGRLEESLAAHDHALRIDPRFSLGKFHKGMLEAALGRHDAARRTLQQFLALAPPNLASLANEARKRIQELKA